MNIAMTAAADRNTTGMVTTMNITMAAAADRNTTGMVTTMNMMIAAAADRRTMSMDMSFLTQKKKRLSQKRP